MTKNTFREERIAAALQRIAELELLIKHWSKTK